MHQVQPGPSPTGSNAPPLVSATALVEAIDARRPISEISALLDALPPDQQWAQVQHTSRAHQRALFELAAASEPLTAEDFVPATVPDLVPVVHRGLNSLPLFRQFAKPMTRRDGGIFGYNEGATRWLLGPGYFVLHGTADHPEWVERGAQVVDYWQTPEGAVPEGWPRIWPNWFGLQVLVYHQTRDFMRRVSSRVTVGAAYKWERPLDSYFVLVRS